MKDSNQRSDNILLSFWGKIGPDSDQEDNYHPVIYHLLDVGNIAKVLLGESGSGKWKRVLSLALGTQEVHLHKWLPWLVALHDIGKISAPFQEQNEQQRSRLLKAGFLFGSRPWNNHPYHTLISQIFITKEFDWIDLPKGLNAAFRDMAGGHHGRFAPPADQLEARRRLVYEPEEWKEWRREAARLVGLYFLKDQPEPWPVPANISAASMALTGFSILCDWLGSDSQVFSSCPKIKLDEYLKESWQRAQRAVLAAGFNANTLSEKPAGFSTLYPGLQPRPLQQAIDEIPAEILSSPCLAVIEAPTGEGKTEAALSLAHRLSSTHNSNEFYYALPTTATSDQMHKRVKRYLKENLEMKTKVRLIHGQAFLAEDDHSIIPMQEGDKSTTDDIKDWFGPKKRALLAPFGVGTVDQAELGALNVKHASLRLVGLAGKVIIFDEVHAYDTYMTTIIERLLEWLSVLGASVIILSATLPNNRRELLLKAYSGKNAQNYMERENSAAYPRITIAGRSSYYQTNPPAMLPDRSINIRHLHYNDDEFYEKAIWLVQAIAGGGCACWVTNTVDRAQRIFSALDRAAEGDIDRMLLHARFPLEQRQELETLLTKKYGSDKTLRPTKGIVIGTQVLEQSLDLDFDIMVSDLAPIDLLLQRAGRMHRHKETKRPDEHKLPCLWINTVLGDNVPDIRIDSRIYPEYLILRTFLIVQAIDAIYLPFDYRKLVEEVYGSLPPEKGNALYPVWVQLEKQEKDALYKANSRLLPWPNPEDSFCGLVTGLEFEESEESAAWIAAQTRLGEESLTVIPLEITGSHARTLSSKEITSVLLDEPAARDAQLKLLRQGIRVSSRRLVEMLKNQEARKPALFNESALLRHTYPLWLQERRTVFEYGRYTISVELNHKTGLVIETSRKPGPPNY
jgi:CRISPR-associated endonuclease/helicase Cas3